MYNALVMYDKQTGTLWSQFTGTAMKGKLKGARLAPVALALSTWAEWKAEHPDTLALKKAPGVYEGDVYSAYYRADHVTGVGGQSTSDDRLQNKALVLGVGFDASPKAYPHEVLRERRVVNDRIAGSPAIVYFDDNSGTALAFESTVSDRDLTFSLRTERGKEYLVDEETGTKWAPFTGTAVEGELEGEHLSRVSSISSFWFAWTDFYPDTELFQ